MANYYRIGTTINPGLLILMIDQSGAMSEAYKNGETKVDFATEVVNRIILEMIHVNFCEARIKDRCCIAVIGYGKETKLLTSGFISELADSPLRIEHAKINVSDGAGGIVEMDVQRPIFVEPYANGQAFMAEAFKMAKDIIEEFIANVPDCPAPAIINISGGVSDFDAAEKAAKSIMSLSRDDGIPLIFNAYVEHGNCNIKFPANKDYLPDDDVAKFLFDISSVLPDISREYATEEFGLKTAQKPRGYMIGVETDDLVKFVKLIPSIVRLTLRWRGWQ